MFCCGKKTRTNCNCCKSSRRNTQVQIGEYVDNLNQYHNNELYKLADLPEEWLEYAIKIILPVGRPDEDDDDYQERLSKYEQARKEVIKSLE